MRPPSRLPVMPWRTNTYSIERRRRPSDGRGFNLAFQVVDELDVREVLAGANLAEPHQQAIFVRAVCDAPGLAERILKATPGARGGACLTAARGCRRGPRPCIPGVGVVPRTLAWPGVHPRQCGRAGEPFVPAPRLRSAPQPPLQAFDSPSIRRWPPPGPV